MIAERLDQFMARANAIYYASHDPFADFTTAPEVSQVFGELLGLWAAIAWDRVGRPDPVLLVEAGPGRGTLMADALRAVARAQPDFAAAAQVHLIETSPRLRAAQAARLQQAAPKQVTWHQALSELPDGPMILLANEFLDALPIRQFVRRGTGWAERYVGNGAWVEEPVVPPALPPLRSVAEGRIVEINEPARAFAAVAAARLRTFGGVALFIDYGADAGARTEAPGDTLQAIADGRMVNPLSAAGSADLTAHVDFADLARAAAAAGAAVQGPVTQRRFLLQLGARERTERLAASAPPHQAETLRGGLARLIDAAQMGTLFKVMALTAPHCPALPGLAED
ncbi:class I SAM-dependent methyltransferase [Rhodopila sp.]|jgi:SAM-dependent MidA family methyltransferase|uniref:class I SAM-dependent methyltransferase n=1 Tax=Rhodopila sp. TaxID=2480087 RepID=UPI002B5E77BE|nr:SAM-dependent methyltransferase [Rhodopila sp.]HVZ08999.1 SAM-dependent methyltransferase [Rhodopila sp.]